MNKANVILVTVVLLTGSGCGRPAFLTARNNEFPMFEHGPLQYQITSFIKLYEQNCQGCHGGLEHPDQKFDQLTATEKSTDGRFGPAPPLNDALFLTIIGEEELRKVIAQGRTGTLMPAFGVKGTPDEQNGVRGGPLTPEQVDILVKGILGRWGTKKVEDKNLPTYLPKPPASGNVEAGKKLFQTACASCHQAPFNLDNPDFLALMSDQVLRRLIITGRPDLTRKIGDQEVRMPDFRGKEGRGADFKPLTDQDIADLMALLISWRNPQLVP